MSPARERQSGLQVVRRYGAIILTAISVAGGGAAWAAKAVAEAAVSPVERRTTALEAQRDDDRDRLTRMEQQLDRIESKLDDLKRTER